MRYFSGFLQGTWFRFYGYLVKFCLSIISWCIVNQLWFLGLKDRKIAFKINFNILILLKVFTVLIVMGIIGKNRASSICLWIFTLCLWIILKWNLKTFHFGLTLKILSNKEKKKSPLPLSFSFSLFFLK